MRHRLALSLVAVFVATGSIVGLPAQRAAAQESCAQDDRGQYICRWTQLDNNNWPAISDPDCHGYYAYWLHGQCSSTYYYADQINWSVGGIDVHGDMQRAVKAWSGQPYCSPFIYPCNCGSSTINLRAFDMSADGAGICGEGAVTTAWQAYGSSSQYDNHVVSAWAGYNTNSGYPWSDGPPSQSGTYCDAIGIALHEMGHVMTEGHSSYLNDLMCAGTANCKFVESIDGDAQNMLAAVYGTYHNANSSGGSGGCGGCQMACAQTTSVTGADTTIDPTVTINQTLWTVCGTAFALPEASGYYAKAWDLYYGLPSPNPASLLTRPQCMTYFTTKQLVAWLQCELA